MHRWTGTAFGGFKSRSEVPKLIEDYESGKLELDQCVFATQTLCCSSAALLSASP